jgi:hypothetical protein
VLTAPVALAVWLALVQRHRLIPAVTAGSAPKRLDGRIGTTGSAASKQPRGRTRLCAFELPVRRDRRLASSGRGELDDTRVRSSV